MNHISQILQHNMGLSIQAVQKALKFLTLQIDPWFKVVLIKENKQLTREL
jgi:hypothetical protein